MITQTPRDRMRKSKQLFSEITSQGQLNFSLGQVDVPEPKENEVVVRIEAAPINPSDMWPMFGPANLAEASLEYGDTQALLRAPVHAPLPVSYTHLTLPTKA